MSKRFLAPVFALLASAFLVLGQASAETKDWIFEVPKAGGVTKVDRHGVCWNVKNVAVNNVMVPTNQAAEWLNNYDGSFLNHQGKQNMPYIQLSPCETPSASMAMANFAAFRYSEYLCDFCISSEIALAESVMSSAFAQYVVANSGVGGTYGYRQLRGPGVSSLGDSIIIDSAEVIIYDNVTGPRATAASKAIAARSGVSFGEATNTESEVITDAESYACTDGMNGWYVYSAKYKRPAGSGMSQNPETLSRWRDGSLLYSMIPVRDYYVGFNDWGSSIWKGYSEVWGNPVSPTGPNTPYYDLLNTNSMPEMESHMTDIRYTRYLHCG
ncbi:hypothetical protein [Paenirhodobacter populi]|uniref:hypothetical protein n=1 Tax=Paenirhodobacter populi TaxID=2306993 RepID=UPI000FE3AA63|nr:hypothetical protein [Sinirhodobacter populi]RWR05095.1 hypothetical protein D2T32_17775 [Sinirhodobacter populi]